MFLRNGEEFNLHLPHEIDGVQYPATWFLDEAQRGAFGVTEINDPVPPTISATQKAVRNGFQLVEGAWTATWEISEQTAAELAAGAAELAADTAAAIAKTYRDVDDVFDAAIGRRGTEYADAETAARAFVAANYEGVASDYVADFALSNPTGTVQTNQWAADQIIARADAFRAAQLAMRSTRFARQADMRVATTPAELAAAVVAWDGFIAVIRAQLGL